MMRLFTTFILISVQINIIIENDGEKRTVDNFKTVDKIVKLTEPLLSIKRSSRSMNCDIYIFNTKRCYFILD
jgi:hypothetical protein